MRFAMHWSLCNQPAAGLKSLRLCLAIGLLPTMSPAGSMEHSGSVPSVPVSLGSGPLPSLKEEDFEVRNACQCIWVSPL